MSMRCIPRYGAPNESRPPKRRCDVTSSWAHVRKLAEPSSLLLLLCVASRSTPCAAFALSRGMLMGYHSKVQSRPRRIALSASLSPTAEDTSPPSITTSSLPDLYPEFADILTANRYTTPTPIQESSALLAKGGENLLLIAATGSGKTLAYLLPTLSRACHGNNCDVPLQRRTVLIVSPTRELAAQLARDASMFLPDGDDSLNDGASVLPNVLLAVRGLPPPTPRQMSHARVLIGTPNELYAVLTRISGAQNFFAGDTLSGVILDEVDVLLPPAPKTLRTTFDGNSAQKERKNMEQRRKLRAAQRRGLEFHGGSSIKGKSIDSMDLSNSMNSQVLTPTERLLRLIASGRYVGEGEGNRPTLQMLAGSATASRATLDRLNKALRWAAVEGGVIGGDELEGVWKGRMKVCRPEAGDDDLQEERDDDTASDLCAASTTHTIRAVTVPSVVDHKYVSMSKDAANNSDEILANVARAIAELKPETSLVFICGEFSRSLLKEKQKEAPKVKGKTAQSRRNSKRRRVFIEKEKSKKETKSSSGPEPLSVRKACTVLQSLGVDAQPMHVVLGLEPNAGEGGALSEEEDGEDPSEVELPPVLVTFEGSARGLHFDGVDVVFVVGRPTSAASYLHLAGRVGRAVASDSAEAAKVEIRPGTIVSFCSKGRVTELEKWTSQVGASHVEELDISAPAV